MYSCNCFIHEIVQKARPESNQSDLALLFVDIQAECLLRLFSLILTSCFLRQEDYQDSSVQLVGLAVDLAKAKASQSQVILKLVLPSYVFCVASCLHHFHWFDAKNWN